MPRHWVPFLARADADSAAGGGYIKHNVARCWAYETAVLVDQELEDQIPPNDYYQYYAPDFLLRVPLQKHFENQNTRQYLDKVKADVLENLRRIDGAPSVAMQQLPPASYLPDYDSGELGCPRVPVPGVYLPDRISRAGL